MRCRNCAHDFEGNFCPHCGQRADIGRLDNRGLVQPILEVLNLEWGALRTTVELARRPGATMQGYLAGRRVGLMGPVKFVGLMVSLAFVTLRLMGLAQQAAPGVDANVAAEIGRLIEEYGSALLLFTVPMFALATRCSFPAARLNYAEHLAINAYVVGEQNAMSLAILPFQKLGPTAAAIGGAVYFVATVVYFVVVLRRMLARTWWTAVLAGLGLTVGVYVVFLTLLGVVFAWTR